MAGVPGPCPLRVPSLGIVSDHSHCGCTGCSRHLGSVLGTLRTPATCAPGNSASGGSRAVALVSEPPSGSRPAAGRGARRPGAVITAGSSWLDRQGQLRPGRRREVCEQTHPRGKPAAPTSVGGHTALPEPGLSGHRELTLLPGQAARTPGDSLPPATCPLPPSLFLFQNANLAPCGADLDASWGMRGTGSGDPVGLWLGQGSLTGFHKFRSETTPDQGRWQKAVSMVESGSLGQSCPRLSR